MRKFFVTGFRDGGGPMAENMGAPQSLPLQVIEFCQQPE